MVVFCLLLGLTLGTFCRAKNDSTSFYIEAEDGYGFSADSVHWRSNAEGKKTVWLRKDENLRFNFCLPASDNITLEEIRYSTDGLEMEGAVLIDDSEVSGRFLIQRSEEEGGAGRRRTGRRRRRRKVSSKFKSQLEEEEEK